MKIKSAEFVISNNDYKRCPKDSIPEYAFIGRSNVGKSSLINSLVSKKRLAKTSRNPGKTQLINHFIINGSWFLVDLPGYGYAAVSQTKRKIFQKMTRQYLENRKNLICLFVLIDIRHRAQKIDLEFMQNLAENEIPFVIVFTKSDKISQMKITDTIKQYKEIMLTQWNKLPETFIASSVTGTGTEKILSFISKYNNEFLST